MQHCLGLRSTFIFVILYTQPKRVIAFHKGPSPVTPTGSVQLQLVLFIHYASFHRSWVLGPALSCPRCMYDEKEIAKKNSKSKMQWRDSSHGDPVVDAKEARLYRIVGVQRGKERQNEIQKTTANTNLCICLLINLGRLWDVSRDRHGQALPVLQRCTPAPALISLFISSNFLCILKRSLLCSSVGGVSDSVNRQYRSSYRL